MNLAHPSAAPVLVAESESQLEHVAPAPIGIVIPTYNRQHHLRECLRHLELQTWKDFEVLIIDDGSTDSTPQTVERYRHTAPFPLRYLRQNNRGPAAGRNRAIAELQAPLCILIGDDTFPAPDFVRVHLEFHRAHPESQAVALGFTRWSEQGQEITPFMHWAGWDGIQFVYAGLMRGEAPGWKHFYTSNLSFKSGYLRQNPFNENFPKAAMEDIELGYRLASLHGLRMHFLPDAIADHLHPTTFDRTCRRMVDAGEGAYLFGKLWQERRRPETRNPLKQALLRILTEPRFVLPALAKAADLSLRVSCPNFFMRRVLFLHELAGYNRAAAKDAACACKL